VIDHRVPFNTLLSSSNLIRPSTAFGSQGPVQYEVYRFIARPSPGGLLADLQQLREANGLTEEDTLELESKILLSTERNICLHPSPDVGRIASVLEFNKHKLSTRFGASGIGGGRRKRTRLDGTGQTAAVATAAAGSVEDPRDPFERVLALRWPDSYRRSRASESNLKQLYAIASAEGSTKAEFKQVAFVHDWRRNKIVADATQSTCLEKKGSAVAPTLPAGGTIPSILFSNHLNNFLVSFSTASFASRRLSSVVPNQLIRTMKFAKKSASNPGKQLFVLITNIDGISLDQTIYTTLNIYAFIDGTFEASLRWGTRPDTSVGGSTLNFAVGDAKAADNYVLHFVNLYVSCEGNALVSDVRIQPEFAAAQRPRAADHPRSRQQQQPSNPATMGGSGGLPSNSPPPPPSAINTTRTASPALTQTPPAVQVNYFVGL
jgi:hypothetical protein